MLPVSRVWPLLLLLCAGASAQVIEFENNGLKYQTLTRQGVTVMYARTGMQVRDYGMVQVAISNGSGIYWSVKPEDFVFERSDGQQIRGAVARTVVTTLLERGTHGDVVRLVTAYENALYGTRSMRLMNGYEQRRQAAMGEGSSVKFSAAAAASAIALTPVRLKPGQSTDGAVFFPVDKGGLGGGRMTFRSGNEVWTFNTE